MKKAVFHIFLIFLLSLSIYAEDKDGSIVGIVEKLGQSVSLDTPVYDETGNEVTLKEIVDKPTILTFVYFRCPGICTPLLNSLRLVLEKVELEPGKDFKVVTISFDPTENFKTASHKRQNYIKLFKRNFPEEAWRFFTAKEENIRKITASAGFYYQKVGNEYRHPGTLIILSPQGKVSRYLYGISYLPFDLKMALIEASEGRVGPSIARWLTFCYSYDPQGKRYGLNVIRVAGIIVLFFILFFVLFLVFYRKLSKKASG